MYYLQDKLKTALDLRYCNWAEKDKPVTRKSVCNCDRSQVLYITIQMLLKRVPVVSLYCMSYITLQLCPRALYGRLLGLFNVLYYSWYYNIEVMETRPAMGTRLQYPDSIKINANATAFCICRYYCLWVALFQLLCAFGSLQQRSQPLIISQNLLPTGVKITMLTFSVTLTTTSLSSF